MGTGSRGSGDMYLLCSVPLRGSNCSKKTLPDPANLGFPWEPAELTPTLKRTTKPLVLESDAALSVSTSLGPTEHTHPCFQDTGCPEQDFKRTKSMENNLP